MITPTPERRAFDYLIALMNDFMDSYPASYWDFTQDDDSDTDDVQI